MIEIEMNADIREVKPKILLNFTLRQVVCMIIAILVALPILIFVPADWFTRILIAVIPAMVPIACGWFEYSGLPLEQILLKMLRMYLVVPVVRKYKSVNLYQDPDEAPDTAKKKKKIKKSKEYKSFR